MTVFDPRHVPALDSLEVRVRRLVEGRHLGLHKSPFRGTSAEFAEHRPYIPGDNIRSLDWRLYARTDRFYVKRYEEETNLSAHLIVDATASMNFGLKWQAAGLLAGTAAYVLSAQGDAVGLNVISGDAIEMSPRRGRAARSELLTRLDQTSPAGAGSLIPALDRALARSRRTGLFILVSDFISEDPHDLVLALRRIRGRGHDAFALHIISQDELALGATGPTRYVDPESSDFAETVPEDVQADYRRILDAHMSAVAAACRALRFDHLLVIAEEGPGYAFGRFLASRRRAGRGGALCAI